MKSWWQDKGFAERPRYVIANGTELVYRVFDSVKSERLGSYFSPIKADCVSQAELRANIVLWENRCLAQATFRVRMGTGMWIGRVAHGKRDIADRTAQQIWIANPATSVDQVGDVEALRQDVFVGPTIGNA